MLLDISALGYNPSSKNKEILGEVQTDFSLIRMMLDLIPGEKWSDPSLVWLDPACGRGNFMISVYNRLFLSLQTIIPDDITRKLHIIENMLHMVEINEDHIAYLKQVFGEKANIVHADFLSWIPPISFDIIVGNPPFNINGTIKVPTNSILNKKNDGKTIWPSFIRHSLQLLKANGNLLMITPCIWLKPDKANIYPLLTSLNIDKIHCFSNTESNQIFHGHAQTPTCFFLLTKRPQTGLISLYDRSVKRYLPYCLREKAPIPVFGASIFCKLQPYLRKVGHPHVIKTSMPSKRALLSKSKTTDCSYCNVRTCIIQNKTPSLVFEYSNIPLAYYGEPKLILAHKMYGFPYYDKKGEYGISRRDNYVMMKLSHEQNEQWKAFLSTKFALYLFEGTRYRMKYLEKYVFELIPDITKLDDFPETITDKTIADYFQLSDRERKCILGLSPSGKIKI